MAKRFQLKLSREEVELERPDGTIQIVLVCELRGDESDEYQETVKDRMDLEFDEKAKKVRVKGIKTVKGTYSSLLSQCLRDKETDELIPVEDINSYPAHVQKELFEMAQRINGLNDDDEAKGKAKNDSKVPGSDGSA